MADPDVPPGEWRTKICRKDCDAAARIARAIDHFFVCSPKPPSTGTLVALAVELPDGDRLQLQGSIVKVVPPEKARRFDRKPGARICFDERSKNDLVLLDLLAASHLANLVEGERDGKVVATVSGVRSTDEE